MNDTILQARELARRNNERGNNERARATVEAALYNAPRQTSDDDFWARLTAR